MKTSKILEKKTTIVFLITFFIFFTINVKGQFILNGSATQLDSNCYQLTPAVPASIASIWHEDQIDLTNSFDFSFNMNFGCSDEGADGMVFVLYTSTSTLGQSGGDIGYGSNFIPSLGVEFDTYFNNINADLPEDHIAIIRDGNVDHFYPNSLAGPVNASPDFPPSNIEDCAYHQVRIFWNTDNMRLQVYFDCQLRISHEMDIANDIFGGDSMVYWGFTGSTGGNTNVQSICFNTIGTGGSSTNQTVSVCEGESVQLNGSLSNSSYTWTPSDGLDNPNSSNPTATPTEDITYIGTGTDPCLGEVTDTINIVISTSEVNYEIQPAFSDTTICEGEIIDLTIQTDDTNNILWQDGSTDVSYSISEAGTYDVAISNGCATESINMVVETTSCIEEVNVSMPNVFTPDSDGLNDYFGPVSEGVVEIIQFKIFNRWGQVVFDEKTQEGWDGTYKDKAAPSDVYVYTIEFVKGDGTKESMTGDVTLVR